MKPVHVVASQHFPCPPDELFSLLHDSVAMGKAAGLPIAVLKHGAQRGGPGTVRRVGPPLIGVQETILEVVPNQLIRYHISGNGGPIRKHEAQMRLRPDGAGTEMSWIMDFETPGLLAGVLRPALTRLAGFALKRIRRRF